MDGRHERNDPADPTEPQGDVAKVIEVKVVVSALVTLVASVAFAVLDALTRDHHILDALPEWLRFVILAAIPPTLTFLAGYATPSNRV